MMPPRAQLMRDALGFLQLAAQAEAMPPALLALHCWLDSWTGIGLTERGMARQGHDLSLIANDEWSDASLPVAQLRHLSEHPSLQSPRLVLGRHVPDVGYNHTRAGVGQETQPTTFIHVDEPRTSEFRNKIVERASAGLHESLEVAVVEGDFLAFTQLVHDDERFLG
jgi:hypothetical protein